MSRPRPLRDLGLALAFLTVLPVGGAWPEEGAPDAVGFYPWVGFVLGAEALAVQAFAAWRGAEGYVVLVAAAAIVALWALSSRMLHWDGLADTADGLWGSFDVQRRLEIMRDSRSGAFGVTAVVMAALLQVTACAAVLQAGRPWVLLMAPVLGRGAAAAAAWSLPAARREGLGLTAVRRPGAYAVTVACLALAALLAIGHVTAPRVPFFATLGVGILASAALPRLLARRVGGMTGDLFGAVVIGVETAVLMMGALT